MPGIVYENFDLSIQPVKGDPERYLAKVKSEGGGDVSGEPFTIADLLPARDAAGTAVNEVPAAPARDLVLDEDAGDDAAPLPSAHGRPESFEAAKELGVRLFRTIFTTEINVALRRSVDRARARKAKLRLRLNLSDFPELAVIPWEYLCDPRLNHFYAQSIETPIVRYLEHDEPAGELPVTEKLRVLVVASNPESTGRLDVEKEIKLLREALRPLEEEGAIELDLLRDATTEALINKLEGALEENPIHIFHFIGHGTLDRERKEGAVFFHDEKQRHKLVTGEYLGNMLRDNNSLRLAVLNTCQGASTTETSSYAGVAQKLLRHGGIPAVIAMQFEITDEAAINFARRFYGALARRLPVEAALTQARKSILDGGNRIEWATPVLYMRANDGRLFGSSSGEAGEAATSAPAGQPKNNDAGILPQLDAHYQSVVNALLDGRLVFFLGMDAHLYGRQLVANWTHGQPPPCSSELVSYLAQKFSYPLSHQMDLPSISQYVAVKTRGGLGLLYDELADIYREDLPPTRLHRFLAELPALMQTKLPAAQRDSMRQRFIVVTTNYDTLLEKAFQEATPAHHVLSYVAEGGQRGKFIHTKYTGRTRQGRPTTIDVAPEYLGLANQEPVIVKLPGAIDRDDARFAITEDHFFDYLSHKNLTELLPPQIISKLKGSSHLFLGYSLREWNLRALLYRVWEDQKPRYESWTVHPQPEEVDEKFWGACQVESVVAELKDYVEGLEQRLARVQPARA